MGAIQGAINGALGAIAGAAVAGKHMAEKSELKTEQGLLAQEQYHEASADLTKLSGESAEAKKVLDTATEKAEATKKWNMSGKNKKMLEGKAAKRFGEKEAAQKAFDELQDRIEAKKAMMSRAEKIMKKTNTWGGAR